MKKSLNHGFTLIELMIVVAIVAVLAGIAYPSYKDSVLKGRRAEARTALSELMQQQERYMTQNNSYFAFTNVGGIATPVVTPPTTVPFKTFSGDTLAKTAYYLSASACPSSTIAECVMVAAEPVMADPDAGTLQILSTGTKTCTGAKSSVCWK
ncbi:type IV pilin protein [Rhodoferax sediminis]|jgi:type IV pilus assembly protein PilE|uniref:Type IV pilin protein n=1 Tax=Rhodoferax sediminis TaxID=2509614 RepID=A0A515D9V5_9BURK|nr:type IV pilin protein [Rhodoferax sediminis]QDL37179.1 type IV pilin protein [Rhodoferax sediminis]